ncbi:MAG TPA: CPBP family intramembrane glutamic endopeptidase [Steroidobacteraceae bacterium]|nr:CPBP family intramembrane glutamic endopeptidase [Steroidobacteraceae bacterium]
MRIFGKFILLLLGAEFLTAFLTYPSWLLVNTVADIPIHRVRDRVAMLLIAAGLWFFLPRWQLATRDVLGYGLPRRIFLRQLSAGFLAALALMLPLVLALLGLAIRVPGNFTSPAALTGLIGQGLLAGLAVGFIEETCFRGVMYGGIERESGVVLATLLPTVLYAAGHFFGGTLRVPQDQVTFASGFRIVADVFTKFERPLDVLDSFLALCALGVLLSLIRKRTGAIAGGIGLHAGAVCVIWVMTKSTHVNPGSHWAWLVGDYNGVIGWMACAWICVIAGVYSVVGRRAEIHSQ